MLLRVEVAAFHPAASRAKKTGAVHGGLVSVALFLASRRTVVSRHPTLWSPDFPLSAQLRADSDCLTNSRGHFNTRRAAPFLPLFLPDFPHRNAPKWHAGTNLKVRCRTVTV